MILLGVSVISIFKAAASESIGELNQAVEENTLAKFGCILTGKLFVICVLFLLIVLLADVCFAFEIILIKVLAKYSVDGDIVGIFYGFFVGVIGIIGLSIYTVSGGMAKEAFK